MQVLNYPTFKFRFKNRENKIHIFDEIRKKFVLLTPEEWVRQHCLHFLIYHKGYPVTLIQMEKEIKLNGLSRRYDLVVFEPDGQIRLAVECKRPEVKITQEVFDQLARYNLILKAPLLFLTNGLEHYVAEVNQKEQRYRFLPELPLYQAE